ncbi:MAG: hypothetical protein U1G07_02075 [Verrucomicrobiota bacterium]
MIIVGLLLSGCRTVPLRRVDGRSLKASRSGNAVVFGRIEYVIDGQSKLPYGFFRPRWPAPTVNATKLESGAALLTPAVQRDGSFLWELPSGHYVITHFGGGQFTDDWSLAWPRIAFAIPAGAELVYLGDLTLAGTRRAKDFVYSTGRISRVRGIEYAFPITNQLPAALERLVKGRQLATPSATVSLMFHDPAMPIGVTFLKRWQESPEALIDNVFQPSGWVIPPRAP